MHDLDEEAAANGTQSAPLGGTPLFFCKECDSKGVPASILQECDCKGVLASSLQEYGSTRLNSNWQTENLWGFCKGARSSKNGADERDAPESKKFDLSTDDPRPSDTAVQIASMFYFTARVKRHL